MDLMTLAAKITLDDSSYTKGINNAESMGQKLQGRMSAMTVAVGNLAADMIRKGISGVQQIIGGAVEGFADYQQLIGGVETMFKSSANRVADNAKKSFKTTGLSANQYMETVTSFSASLIKGLGGDTEAAAELANTAVTDMADNANKMGTDMSSIQAAYQGFAKQNYTMLDNLKLGYGGTQSEMVRLINDSKILDHQIESMEGVTFDQMIAAIHEIQSQMGITGTTAKEAAETISGSKASMKAAWEDLLAAVGGAGTQNDMDRALENFKESFSTYMTNFIPTLVQTIAGSGTLVAAVADAIGSLPTTLLSEIGEKGMESGAQMVGGLTKVVSWLIDSITEMFHAASLDNTAAVNLGAAIGDFLGTAISKIVTNAGTIFEGIVAVGTGLASGLIDGLISGLLGGDGLPKRMNEINEQLSSDISKAVEDQTRASGILEYMEGLVSKYGEAAKNTEEWKKAAEELNKVMPGTNEFLETQKNSLKTAVKNLKEYAKETEKLVIAEAKRKALESKQEAYTEAQAKVWSAKTDIKIKQNESRVALRTLEGFFNGKKDYETGENIGFRFDKNASADQIKYAVEAAYERMTGGKGNAAYSETELAELKGLVDVVQENEKKMNDLKGTISDLETQLEIAKTDYLTSSAAIDELTGAASGAAQALELLKHPETTYNSGQYYNWKYGQKHAKGAWDVPYDEYPAILHRGERVLTASQARQSESQGVNLNGMYEIVREAIREGMSGVRVEAYMDSRKVTRETNKTNRNSALAGRFRT